MSAARLVPVLGAVAVAVVLGVFIDDPWLRLHLPDIVVALALSILAFASEERPLIHEAQELGVGPRAVLQGLGCAVVLALLQAEHYARPPGSLDRLALLNVAVQFQTGMFTILPAWLETRARARGRREVTPAIGVSMAAALALLLARPACIYTWAILDGASVRCALDDLRRELTDLRSAQGLTEAWPALVFLLPALARMNGARPRTVLVAALASAEVAGVAGGVAGIGRQSALGWVGTLLDWAIALGLGAAFADKLVRKIEKRLPGHHAD